MLYYQDLAEHIRRYRMEKKIIKAIEKNNALTNKKANALSVVALSFSLRLSLRQVGRAIVLKFCKVFVNESIVVNS